MAYFFGNVRSLCVVASNGKPRGTVCRVNRMRMCVRNVTSIRSVVLPGLNLYRPEQAAATAAAQ